MGKALKRMWKYLTAALTGKFDEMADPKIQLEQAIAEAQDQQRRLKEQAANVIANQKQTEMRLNRVLEENKRLRKQVAELERVNDILRSASAYFASELDPARRRS